MPYGTKVSVVQSKVALHETLLYEKSRRLHGAVRRPHHASATFYDSRFDCCETMSAFTSWPTATPGRTAPRLALQRASQQVASILDSAAVTALRLALLGAVVWCGTSIVTHVTSALQGMAGPSVQLQSPGRIR